MSEVSYQAFLPGGGAPAAAYAALGPDAVATRPKEAKRTLTVRISKGQEKWLDGVTAHSGDGVDADAVVRALIDVGRELEIDWALIAGGAQLRQAVRDAVRVRRTPDDGTP